MSVLISIEILNRGAGRIRQACSMLRDSPGGESHDNYCCQTTSSAKPTEVLPFRLQAEAAGDARAYFTPFHGLFSPSLLHKGVLKAQWCKKLPDHTGCSVHRGAVMKYMRGSITSKPDGPCQEASREPSVYECKKMNLILLSCFRQTPI